MKIGTLQLVEMSFLMWGVVGKALNGGKRKLHKVMQEKC